jgi:hypothetical protein
MIIRYLLRDHPLHATGTRTLILYDDIFIDVQLAIILYALDDLLAGAMMMEAWKYMVFSILPGTMSFPVLSASLD